MWEQWKEGQSLSDLGRNLGKHAGSIHRVVSSHGGISRCPRRRSRWALSVTEREEISRGLAAHYSLRHIAAALGRPPSTVSREVARHGGRQGYRATLADVSAWEQARRPKRCRLADQPRLRRLVADKLAGDWSPEPIAGWVKRQFPEDTHMRISHETIYRSLFIQTRGVLKKELTRHLRSRRTMRRAKRASTEGQPRGQIIDGISIGERPAAINDRAFPGHWEGDLLSGSNNTHMATLVERQSRFTLVKVAGKDTGSVVNALIPQVQRLPVTLRRSLTWDRGMEMAAHKQLTVATQEKSIFVIHPVPGNGARMKIPIGCSASIFPKGRIWLGTHKRS